jgi:UDPglucose 6-dehydrogenase
VVALDVVPEKVEKINNKISPIKDEEIEKAIVNMKLTNNHLISSNDSLEAIINSQIVDLVSKDVKKINERYFQKYPLLLDFMFED